MMDVDIVEEKLMGVDEWLNTFMVLCAVNVNPLQPFVCDADYIDGLDSRFVWTMRKSSEYDVEIVPGRLDGGDVLGYCIAYGTLRRDGVRVVDNNVEWVM